MSGQWNRFAAMLMRDLLLIAFTGWLWRLAIEHGAPEAAGGYALHVATALMTVIAAYLVHEWGHLIGAWISGSRFFCRHTSPPARFCFASTMCAIPAAISCGWSGAASCRASRW